MQVFDEAQGEKDQDFAMWVFETMEEINECTERDDLLAVQMDLQSQYDDKITRIGQLFEAQTGFDRIKYELEKTRYYQRMLDEIEKKLDSI